MTPYSRNNESRPHDQQHYQQKQRNDGIIKRSIVHYTTRDLLLYALSIGCSSSSITDTKNDQKEDVDNKYQSPLRLQYLYENSYKFKAFPTFPLTLPFRSSLCINNNNNEAGLTKPGPEGIIPFPSPAMAVSFGIDLEESSSSQAVVLHVSQSFRLHRSIPVPYNQSSINSNNNNSNNSTSSNKVVDTDPPIPLLLETKVVSSSASSFRKTIVSETETRTCDGSLLCTARSTTIVMGDNKSKNGNNDRDQRNNSGGTTKQILSTLRPPNHIFRYARSQSRPPQSESSSSLLSSSSSPPPPPPPPPPDAIIKIPSIQLLEYGSLLYRLNGDYNPIHIDGSAVPSSLLHQGQGKGKGQGNSKKQTKQSKKPILHGLCTLAHAVRLIMERYTIDNHDNTINDNNNNNGNNVEKDNNDDMELRYAECRFVSPIFEGEGFSVYMWNIKDGKNNNNNNNNSNNEDGDGRIEGEYNKNLEKEQRIEFRIVVPSLSSSSSSSVDDDIRSNNTNSSNSRTKIGEERVVVENGLVILGRGFEHSNPSSISSDSKNYRCISSTTTKSKL